MASTRASAPAGMSDIHIALGTALRGTARADWPARPHAGGPLPLLTAIDQVGLAVWVADRVRELVKQPERARFTRAVELARAVHRAGGEGDYAALDEAAAACRSDEPALAVGRGAAAAARSLVKGGATISDVGKFAGMAAAGAARLLGASPDASSARARAFLDELDGRIMLVELEHALAERDHEPTSPPEAVLARPSKGKRPGVIVARLADGRWGGHIKVGARWRWIEGRRDDVVACIPADCFEAATLALPR
jgi:hypothetical protein